MSETNKLNIIETESNIIFDSCAHSKIDLSLNNDNCTIFNDITMGTNILNLSRYIYVGNEEASFAYAKDNIIREKEFDIVKDPYEDDIYYIVLNNIYSDTNDTSSFQTYICVLQEDINENLTLINKISIDKFDWKYILDIDQNYIYAWGIEYYSTSSSSNSENYSIYVYKISKSDYSYSEIYRYVNKLKADVIFMGKNETYFSFLLKYENSRNINNKPFLKIIRFDKTTQTITQSQKTNYNSMEYKNYYSVISGSFYTTGYTVNTISWIPVYNYDYYNGVQIFEDNIIRITEAHSNQNFFAKENTYIVAGDKYENTAAIINFKLFRELANIICKKGIKINNTYYILYPAVSSNTNFNYAKVPKSYSSHINPSTGLPNYTTTIREKLINNFHLISYNVDSNSFSENLQFTNIKYITNLKWFDDKDTIYKVWDNDDRIFYAVYNANTNNKDAMLNIQAIHIILKNNGNFTYEKSIFPSKTSQIIAITNTEDTKKILVGYPGAIEIWEYDETNNTYVQGKKITQVLTGGFDNLGRVIYKDVNKNTFILDTKDCESVDLQFEKQRYIFFNQPIDTYLDFSSKNYMGTETKSTFDITLTDNCVFEDSGTNTITVNHTEPQRINFSIIDSGNIECTVRYNKNWSNYE